MSAANIPTAHLDRERVRRALLILSQQHGILATPSSQTDDESLDTLAALVDFARREPDEPAHIEDDAPHPVLAEVDARLDTRRVDNAGATRIAVLRSAYSMCLRTLEDAAPAGRHRSLAVTALEESCLWAVKAVSHAE